MSIDVNVGKTNLTNLLREKYKKLGTGWVTLLRVPTESHMKVNTEALKVLINEMKYSCIYITLGKSSTELDKLFKSKGVDVSNLYYLDAISQMYGVSKTSTKKCVYVSGPLDIDSITVSLRELLSTMQGKKKCVFLDSITTVLLYNSLSRTIRFSKFLTKTLKDIGVDGIMVSVAKGKATDNLVKELGKLCDEIVSLKTERGRNI